MTVKANTVSSGNREY